MLSYIGSREVLSWPSGLWRHGTLFQGHIKHKDHSLSSCTRKVRQAVSNAQLSTPWVTSELCTGGGFPMERKSYSSLSEVPRLLVIIAKHSCQIFWWQRTHCLHVPSSNKTHNFLSKFIKTWLNLDIYPDPAKWLTHCLGLSFSCLGWDCPFLNRESEDDSSPESIPGSAVLWPCCSQKPGESKNTAYNTAGREGENFNTLFLNTPLSLSILLVRLYENLNRKLILYRHCYFI